MSKKSLDPLPWKCRADKTRLGIGYTQGHHGCLKWKPRKHYEQKLKKYLKNDRWLNDKHGTS